MYRISRFFVVQVAKTWPALLLLCSFFVASEGAHAHGYVSVPESRSLLCKQGLNEGCGAIQWEPQSVEGPDGSPRYPIGGPSDGTIAAAGSPAWSELNAQTPSRWYKHRIAAGSQTFEWTFTANHVAKDWRYFITKAGWNASEPLARRAFEAEPFCAYDGGMVRPPLQVSHACVVPERFGYHVILAVWDVGDTAASFYNAIDVQFGGDDIALEPTEPEEATLDEVGVISGAIALRAGDSLETVVFDGLGERPEFNVRLIADRDLSGPEASLLLATAVNEFGNYAAGRRDGEDVTPELGVNRIYAASPIVRVETRATFTPVEALQVEVSSLPSEVTLDEQNMSDISFRIHVSDESAVSASVYSSTGQLITTNSRIADGAFDMALHLHNIGAGAHNLVVIATSVDGQRLAQETVPFSVVPSVTAPEETPEETPEQSCEASDPAAGNFPPFSLQTTYLGGETISFNGLVYRAKWWTRGTMPSESQAFDLISDVLLNYDRSRVYEAGDRALYDDGVYEAEWWTRGSAPGTDPWRYVGEKPRCE